MKPFFFYLGVGPVKHFESEKMEVILCGLSDPILSAVKIAIASQEKIAALLDVR